MHNEPTAITLPKGRHFAVTWGISDQFGGMTSALLHRSRAFVRLAGTPVDILTVDARPDYPQLARKLESRGELIDGIGVINLWEWLREYKPPNAHPLRNIPNGFSPLARHPSYTSRYRGQHELSRTRYAEDGSTGLQTDHFRLDGSLLLSERSDVRNHGVPGGASLVLCDPDGRPIRSWGGMWAFYRFWLDELRQGVRSYFIVDSKTSARFMHSYRRHDAVVAHLVHGSHLTGARRPIAPLRESRRFVFEHLDDYDAVVLLTQRQKDDVVELLGPHRNLAVVPNSTDIGDPPPLDRSREPGMALAALYEGKRIEHAARAIIDATREAPGVTLDIFGEGPSRESIEALVRESDAQDIVRLHGYKADARQRLRGASFLLLTSKYEGFSLVILESMAAGCLPIAYDVPYGPSDMIRHGENGFVVPAGDCGAVTAAIVELQSLPEARVRRLRENARATAEQYSDEAVVRMWARELDLARKRKLRRPLLAAADALIPPRRQDVKA